MKNKNLNLSFFLDVGINTPLKLTMAGRNGINPAHSIIAYKKYARAHLVQQKSISHLWSFILELSRNDAINSFFNINDHALEFVNLEEDYKFLKNDVDFIPLYESIQHQLENRKKPIQNVDYLDFLYAAVISQSLAIRNHTRITTALDVITNERVIREKIEALYRDRIEYIKRIRDEHKQSLKERIKSAIEYTTRNEASMDEVFNRTIRVNDENGPEQLKTQMIRHQLVTPLKSVQSLLSLVLIRNSKIVHSNFMAMVETSDIAYKMQQLSNVAKHFQCKLPPIKEMLKDFAGLLKEDKSTQLNEIKRTTTNLTRKMDEILASNRIAPDVLSNDWQHFKNIITSGKLHIEMQKSHENKVNSTIDRLNRMQNLMKCSELGIDAYRLCRNDSSKMIAFNEHVDKFTNQMKKWKEFGQKIYEILMPWLRTIENSIGNPYVYVSKWHILSLEELVSVFGQMQQQSANSSDLERIISDTKQLTEFTLGLYNQIQMQISREKLAKILENSRYPIQNVGSHLQKKIESLNETITTHLMLEICMTTREVLKMRAFPIVHNYTKLCDISTDPKAKHIIDSIIKTEHSNAKAKKNEAIPFYVWKYRDFKNDIKKLLSGKKVIFNSDILTAPKPAAHYNAIKFNRIWLNFTMPNRMRQNDLDKALNGYLVKMAIIGTNYYFHCDGRIYYVPSDANSLLTYQIKSENIDVSNTSDLFGSAKLNSFLSPYSIWLIQLDRWMALEGKLQEFSDEEIDLQLIGEGYYFTNNEFEPNVCKNDELNRNYQFVRKPGDSEISDNQHV